MYQHLDLRQAFAQSYTHTSSLKPKSPKLDKRVIASDLITGLDVLSLVFRPFVFSCEGRVSRLMM